MPYNAANARLMVIPNDDAAIERVGQWTDQYWYGYTLSTTWTPSSSISLEFDGRSHDGSHVFLF